MKNAVRKQTDVDKTQRAYSDKSAITFDPKDDTTRQEFKHDTDVNTLLQKFGVMGPQRPPTFGQWDTDLDLQGAIHAVHMARGAYARLPKELRERYKTWDQVMGAIERGEIKQKGESDTDAVEKSGKQDVPSGDVASGSNNQP